MASKAGYDTYATAFECVAIFVVRRLEQRSCALDRINHRAS
jgi:hypothetical protein